MLTSKYYKMARVTKKRKAVNEKVDETKLYSLEDAMKLVKEVNITKFDASVDVHIRLGIDPRKSDQALRGTVSLPHGTGKSKKVLVLCTPEKEEEAKAAGADFVGLDEFITKIQGGWVGMDVVIAMPNVMAKIGRVARILGPRGLMPNPKTGTVTPNVGKAVEEVKKGKVSFTSDQLTDNANELLSLLNKLRPSSAKGIYMKSVNIASTMSPGIKVDPRSIK